MLVAGALDDWDTWNDQREQHLAQQRHERKYYDDDLWGAEDLDLYGSWIQTNDYGWIWRPHTTAISRYANWAPYRYGEWAWVSPYGWFWVGSEPWGWAPYHYGRWVYYDGYRGWSPRGLYQRKRSWWRPALVGPVINTLFGDQICWYPLDYHDRDPRSRELPQASRPRSRSTPNTRLQPKRSWSMARVTALPRRDFGAPHARPRHGDERWGRRVAEAGHSPTSLSGLLVRSIVQWATLRVAGQRVGP